MLFKNPLDIRCKQCGEHFSESIDWLMQDGRQCPKCGTSFAPDQERIRSMVQDHADFITGVEFIIEIEDRWQIELPDEQVLHLRTAESICKFIVDACKRKDRRLDLETVRAGVYHFAAEKLRVAHVEPETDLFAPLRRATEPQLRFNQKRQARKRLWMWIKSLLCFALLALSVLILLRHYLHSSL